jgi:hypothetical protein
VPITFSNIAQVNINGQNEDDNLTVTTPAGGTLINLTPGAVADAGTVTLRQFIGAGGSPLVGLNFVNLSTNDALGRLSFANASGRIDSLTINGVANASEIFSVSSAGNINLDQPVAVGVPNGLLLNVATPGVSELQLVGLATNDTFYVAGNHPFTAGVFVDGDPGTLNFTGDGTAAVTADLGASTVTETGFGPVGYTGVGTVNISVGGNALTIDGTAGDDNLTYTPTVGGTQGAGTVTDAGQPTTLNFNGVTGTFTLNPLGGNNTVMVKGTSNADTFSVSVANGGRRLLVTPTSVAVQGAPVVNLAGVSQINFLNSVVDVSALIKLLFRSKVKDLSGHRLKIHFTLGNLSALALGGPLVLIFSGLTGRARVLGVSGSTTLPTPAGVNLPWIGIYEGAIPVIHSGQQIGFDVIFHTHRSRVSFTPFFVIAGRAP